MKKTLFSLLLMVIFLNMPNTSFAENFYGWWKSDEASQSAPHLLKITDKSFAGLKYKIIHMDNDCVKISLNNSKNTTNIKIKDDENIVMTTVRGVNVSYKLITRDTKYTKQDIKKMLSIDDTPVSRPDPF